jgi:chemotaxis protein methyltransferase CheR
MNDSEYEYLKLKIKKLIGVNLDNYKPNQMLRRLDWYISRSRMAGVPEFCSALEINPEEVEKLQDFLTINVSEFYRDLSYFEVLRAQVLPGLLKERRCLKIWSAGCSHGEESYSLAIILNEISPFGKHQIVGTDIDKAGRPGRSVSH